jgi:hypothetical protein
MASPDRAKRRARNTARQARNGRGHVAATWHTGTRADLEAIFAHGPAAKVTGPHLPRWLTGWAKGGKQ